jgi:hypothetical protein
MVTLSLSQAYRLLSKSKSAKAEASELKSRLAQWTSAPVLPVAAGRAPDLADGDLV